VVSQGLEAMGGGHLAVVSHGDAVPWPVLQAAASPSCPEAFPALVGMDPVPSATTDHRSEPLWLRQDGGDTGSASRKHLPRVGSGGH
jgi:hypothetical protein